MLDLLTGAHGGKMNTIAAATDPRHRLVAPRLVVRDGPSVIAAGR